MASRVNPRLSVPIEDEYTLRRRMMEENLNEKKKQLREEFERHDEKAKTQDIKVLSQNEVKVSYRDSFLRYWIDIKIIFFSVLEFFPFFFGIV
jgi:hypothetical protein